MITKLEVENILKTLPIGYYLKRDVEVKLSDSDATCYDIMNDKIIISYPQIAKTFINKQVTEEDIRCLLYHETSHAMLTPKNLQVTDINNIFEDERIETILRHFYSKVDFKKFIIKFNNFNGQAPTSAMDMFYQIVRFRKGPQQFVDRVKQLIYKYRRLSNNNCHELSNYQTEISILYNDVEDYFNQFQNELNQNQSKNNQTENDQTENDKQCSTNNTTTTTQDNYDVDDSEYDDTFANQIIKSVLTKYDSKSIETELQKILSSVKNIAKNNGSAINAYSGKFDPRSVTRNDYKFFVQQNRNGHAKAFSKLHLNLFIDCSGSFNDNDKIVNKLLKSLNNFEKHEPNFDYDLISCGQGQTIRDKDDRFQESCGGTLITSDIFEQYKQVQHTNSQNINIVLYDGDACEAAGYSYKYEYAKNFSVFNNSKCIIISDYSNDTYLRKYCSSAKVILTNDYTSELEKNVLIALSMLCK